MIYYMHDVFETVEAKLVVWKRVSFSAGWFCLHGGVVAMLSKRFVSRTCWQPCRPPPQLQYTLLVVVGTIDIVLCVLYWHYTYSSSKHTASGCMLACDDVFCFDFFYDTGS